MSINVYQILRQKWAASRHRVDKLIDVLEPIFNEPSAWPNHGPVWACTYILFPPTERRQILNDALSVRFFYFRTRAHCPSSVLCRPIFLFSPCFNAPKPVRVGVIRTGDSWFYVRCTNYPTTSPICVYLQLFNSFSLFSFLLERFRSFFFHFSFSFLFSSNGIFGFSFIFFFYEIRERLFKIDEFIFKCVYFKKKSMNLFQFFNFCFFKIDEHFFRFMIFLKIDGFFQNRCTFSNSWTFF